MKVETFLKLLTKHNNDVKIYCDDKVYAKCRDNYKDMICYNIKNNGLYLYTTQNKEGVNLYTVVLKYQFNPNIKSTKKRKVEVKDYITKDISLARLWARRKYALKEEVLSNEHIYTYDVEIRVYLSKKDYKLIYFNKKDLE